MIFSTLLWGAVRVHSGVANLASKYDCSNPLFFRDMAFLCFYFYFFFFKKLRYKKTNRTWISQPYSGLLSEYSHGLQIWSPILTAQILLVFENWRFLWFFHVFFSKKKLDVKKLDKKTLRTSISHFLVGCRQGTFWGCKSGVPVWLLKSFWFSRNCVFYDFFHFFDQKTDIKKTELQILNSIVGCCQGSFSSCKSGV